MQVMHDSAPPRLKDVLPHPTVAGTAALPASHVGQGTFHRYLLAQFCTPVRRLLTCAPLLQQCFIGMNADAATRDTRRAALSQRTSGTGCPWQLDHATGRKGHRHTTRTPQFLALPVPFEGGLGTRRSLPHGSCFAKHGHVIGPLLDQQAGQVGPLDRPFVQRGLLARQFRLDGLGHTGLGRGGGRAPHGDDPLTIPIAPHVALVAIQ